MVWGDDFKEHRIAKPQKKIVRSHAGMLSAKLWRDPERLTHKLRTGFKRWCGDGNVVDETERHSKAPNVELTGAARHYRAASSDRRWRGRPSG